MTLVIIYEEMAPYFQSCLIKFIELFDAKIYVFCKRTNNVAPFEFDDNQIQFHFRDEWNENKIIEFIEKLNPNGIYYGGWASSSLRNIAQQFKGRILNIVGFDNKFTNSIKQMIVNFVYPILITRHFDYCFIPGIEQEKYAQKIGFNKDQIILGVYSCDYEYFNSLYLKNKGIKKQAFPKRFIYVGRYDKSKGLTDLWEAFIDFQKNKPNEWELWCVGKGDIQPVSHPKIKHLGFVQPKDLSKIIEQTGVFVLPSHYEPWGVVIHEFCAAGFPIICSDQVSARTQFVKNRHNGYVFQAKNKKRLAEIFNEVNSLTDDELNVMSELSNNISKSITPEIWARKLNKILTE